jgi:hypothetical protein
LKPKWFRTDNTPDWRNSASKLIVPCSRETFFLSERVEESKMSDDGSEIENNPVAHLSVRSSASRPRVFIRRPMKRKIESEDTLSSSMAIRPFDAIERWGNPNAPIPIVRRRRRRPSPPPPPTRAEIEAALARARPMPNRQFGANVVWGNPNAPFPLVSRRRRLPSPPPLPMVELAAPPLNFGLDALLERHEAEPFLERTSLVDCDPLESLPGIEGLLAALAVNDDIDDQLYMPDRSDGENDDDDDIVDVVVRQPHSSMFTKTAVLPLLDLLRARVADEAAVTRTASVYVDQFVRPPLIELAGTATMVPASASLSAVVPTEWCAGNSVIVGRSSARGQCLFSSVGILLFGSGADRVALRLRAICIFELVERWAQYVAWFDFLTVRDMLASLVGAPVDDVNKFGYAWPTADVLLPLANVLTRRIVVVKSYSDRLKRRGYPTEPHAVLPVTSVNNDEWSRVEPLVIVFDGDHYKPLLLCGSDKWSIDWSRLAVEFETASPALVQACEALRQHGEIRIRCALDST